MRSLFVFLYRVRVFIVFVFLEIACLLMIVRFNNYQGAAFFNTSNYYVGQITGWTNSVEAYFHLREENQYLAQENTRLHTELLQERQRRYVASLPISDSIIINKYQYVPARVVNKTTSKTKNYITLEKGSKHGLRPGMGVVAASGVVGKITDCSPYFSVVASILNTELTIGAKIKRNNYIGTIEWPGKDSRFVKLTEVPLPIEVKKGDTIVTAGTRSYFPQGSMIGIITKIGKNANATYHDIDVQLSTDFVSLNYAYVIINKLQPQQDSLERARKINNP